MTPIRITVETVARTKSREVPYVPMTKHLDGCMSDEDLAYLARLTQATTPLRTRILINHIAELLSGFKGAVQSLTLFPDEKLNPSVEAQKELDEALERIKAWDSGRKRFVVLEQRFGIIDPARPEEIQVLADHSGMWSHNVGIVPSGFHRPATREDFERFRVSLDGYENDPITYNIPE